MPHNLNDFLAEIAKLTADEQDGLILGLAYLKVRSPREKEGLTERDNQFTREIIENFLQMRFGTLDEELINIIGKIMKLSSAELIPLLININNISREDLLARFSR